MHKAAQALAQDTDVAKSKARPENGVLTLKPTKVQPESTAVTLAIN